MCFRGELRCLKIAPPSAHGPRPQSEAGLVLPAMTCDVPGEGAAVERKRRHLQIGAEWRCARGDFVAHEGERCPTSDLGWFFVPVARRHDMDRMANVCAEDRAQVVATYAA